MVRQNDGFASGRMMLRNEELEIRQADVLEKVCQVGDVCFSRPKHVPEAFHCMGHHARRLGGSRGADSRLMLVKQSDGGANHGDALREPQCYSLIWKGANGCTLWLPVAPPGYRALGFVVTSGDGNDGPSVKDVVCAREDLTTPCRAAAARDLVCSLMATVEPPPPPQPASWRWRSLLSTMRTPPGTFHVWRAVPEKPHRQGLCLGTFHAGGSTASVATLLASDGNDSIMPSREQLQELLCKYAPILQLHPDEAFLPSSVEWFFEQGALLCCKSELPERVQPPDGANLPAGGSNDGLYWLDLPAEAELANSVQQGNITSAKAYVHAKSMFGGTSTDLQLWIFYPFNGPASLKLGLLNFGLSHIGEHVSDWEHITLRINNLDGTLSGVYLAQHSSGQWLKPDELEYDTDSSGRTRALVYSSKHGHATYPHQGDNMQGNNTVGIKNQTKRGGARLELWSRNTLVSADYLGPGVVEEPHWLNYMREWGPKLEYKSRAELDKLLHRLPPALRKPLRDLVNAFPDELYGQEGPTGPKQKDYWNTDERP